MAGNIRKTILISIGVILVVLLGVWWASGFSLDFMKFFAAEPEVVATSTPTPTALVGGPVQCSPATQTTASSTAVPLSASGGDGTYAWFAPEGNPPTGTGAAFSVSYPSAGTKKVTLQSSGADGSINTTVCTVVVQ